MMSVTIHDEATREIVTCAIYFDASEQARGLDDLVGGYYIDTSPEEREEREQLTGVLRRRLRDLSWRLATVDRVRHAPLGHMVDVELSEGRFAEGVRVCLEGMEGMDDVLRFPAEERGHILACHDAAERLLRELSAEAVVS